MNKCSKAVKKGNKFYRRSLRAYHNLHFYQDAQVSLCLKIIFQLPVYERPRLAFWGLLPCQQFHRIPHCVSKVGIMRKKSQPTNDGIFSSIHSQSGIGMVPQKVLPNRIFSVLLHGSVQALCVFLASQEKQILRFLICFPPAFSPSWPLQWIGERCQSSSKYSYDN